MNKSYAFKCSSYNSGKWKENKLTNKDYQYVMLYHTQTSVNWMLIPFYRPSLHMIDTDTWISW